MIESRYLKDNIENIQKLMTIPALQNFETHSLSNLLKLSKIRQYQEGEVIIQEGDSDLAKSRPILGFTCTCRKPACVISTGSSAVHIFTPGSLMLARAECRVVVFPEPVGPTHRMRP
jgi:hypothetical protein